MAQTRQPRKSQAKRAKQNSVQRPASAQSATDVRTGYALSGSSPEPNLQSLFDVLATIDKRESRIELSQLIRTRLRDIFPAGSGKTGTAHLRNGLHFDVDLGDLFGAEFYVGNMNEADVLNALAATLPSDARTVDVGANFGLFGIHAAHVAPEGKVVALEPLPSAYDLLTRNIEQNDLSDRIEAVNAAVSHRGGKAKFFVATDGAFSGLRDTGRSPLLDTVTVSKIALDKCAPVQALDRIDFLKIDTEGHEAGVLAGAKATLDRSPETFVMLEYSHKNLTEASRADLLGELDRLMEAGFSAVAYDDDRKLNSLSKADDISTDTAGTIFLSGEKCAWSETFFAALRSEIKASAPSKTDRSALLILSEFSKVRSQVADIEALNVIFPADEAGTPLSKRITREVAKLRTDLGRSARNREKAASEEERIAAYRDHAKSIQRKLEERTEAFGAKVAQLERTLDERTETLTSKAEAFQVELQKQQKRAQRTQETLQSVEADRESLKTRAAELEGRVSAFRDSAKATQEKLDARTKAFELKTSALEKTLAQQIDSAAKEQERLQKKAAGLEARVSEFRDLSEATQERLTAFRDHAKSLQAKLDARTDALEKANISLNSERAAHSEARAHLQTSRELRAELRRELETSAAEKAALQAEIETLRGDRNKMSAEIDEQRSMIRSLQQLDSLHQLGLGKHLGKQRG